MKHRTLPLVAILTLAGAGCAQHTWHRVPLSPDLRLSNAQEYDTYVVRRTDQLAAGGRFTRDQAQSIAEDEATRRYGTRTNDGSQQSAHWRWTNDNSHELSLAELDSTMAAMKKSSR